MKKIFFLLIICMLSSSLSAQVKKTTTKRPQITVKKPTVPTPKDGTHVSKLLTSVAFNKDVTTSAGASQSNISDLPSYKQEIVKAGIINTNYTTTVSDGNTSGSSSGGGVVYPVIPQPVYNGGMYNGGYNNSGTTGGSTQKDYHNHKCFKCSQSGIYTCPCHSVATFGNTRYHDCPNCGLKHQVGTRHTCRCNDCGGDGVK